MKLLFDVDGVVADTRQALLDAAEIEKDPDPKQWDLVKTLSGDEKDRAIEVMNDHNFWVNLPLKDGAKKAIRLLRAAGHEIVWVTSPWKSCFGWDTARRIWIREHFGEDSVITTRDKYHVDGDVFIDDKVDNVEKWRKTHPGKKAFIFDAPSNQDYTGAPRFSWDKVEKLL